MDDAEGLPRPEFPVAFDAELGPALVDIALELGTAAAALLLDGLDRVRASIDTKSSATDLVTEMDKASERLIVEGITARRPDDGILGEEGTDRVGTSGVRWIIDPLDGTTNYVYGHPGFGVSIAVEQVGRLDGAHDHGGGRGHGRVFAGVVIDAVHREQFTAVRGAGAERNGRPISCSDGTDLAQALVGTGFSYEADRRARQGAVLGQVLPCVRDIRRMGAAAVDLCSVACGRIDAFYERGLAPWDYAAGALIASEAGAVVADLDGRPTSPAFTLAAPPGLFGPLRDLLDAAGAREA